MTVQQAQDASGAAESSVDTGGDPLVDLFVIGGGINGTGIARDAAGRGLRVALVEQGDLAQGTSSRSSRLIHGGLRYLEYGELRLVREALLERETLLRIAPHLVHPLRFVLPHVAGMRPAWVLRLGLFLYDHLASRRRLPASRSVRLDAVPEGEAVRPETKRGFFYSDCRTDDARLVALNAVGARERGAGIRTRTEFAGAAPHQGLWQVRLRDVRDGSITQLRARAIVNAAGPWVERVAPLIAGAQPARHARLVKGSHFVVPKFWAGDHAFLLQNSDRRAIFVMPYEEQFALVGTTDIPWSGTPESVAASDEEIDYLLDAVNRQLRCALAPRDIIYRYAGVRSLADDEHADPSAVTRDYRLDLVATPDHPPVLTVLGGKITTYRRLAEHALALLRDHLPAHRGNWTADRPLPGGDFDDAEYGAAETRFALGCAFLPPEHARGLFRRHGTIANGLVEGVRDLAGMGRYFGAGLYEREARHLVENEWARAPEDVLWRRTKAGLRMNPDELRGFTQWMEAQGFART